MMTISNFQSFRAENGETPTVRTAAALFQEFLYTNKDKLSAGLIVAGYDEATGGEVYSIPLGGSLHKQDIAIGGSGSTVRLYLAISNSGLTDVYSIFMALSTHTIGTI